MQTLRIVALDPDNFTGKDAKFDITQQLQRKIHVAAINATNIPYNHPYKMATKSQQQRKTKTKKHKNATTAGAPQGGVGVLIQKGIEPFISAKNSVNRRIMTVTLNRTKR